MQQVREKPFMINGIKSQIHCLYQHVMPYKDPGTRHYHYHDYIELLYAIEANADIWINGECHKFTTGDFVVLNSMDLHDFVFIEECKYICIKFLPQILYSDEQAFFELKYVIPFLSDNSRQKIFKDNELKNLDLHSLILEMMSEWNEKNTGYELIIRSNILRIFAGIFRYWRSNGIIPVDMQLSDEIKNALTYMAYNYDTVTEKAAAKHCGLSYNHFSYVFKKSVGKNFNDYLLAIKLNEAEKLLISTDKSITEIAFSTGFSSASHFISRFKMYKDITPRKFREQVKKEVY